MSKFKITGRKIENDHNPVEVSPTVYKEAGEFLELIDRILEHPDVEGVIFVGYTPYFNDGDPCEFGVHVRGLVLKDVSFLGEDFESDEYYGSFEGNIVSEYDLYTWDRETRERAYLVGGRNTKDLYDLVTTLDDELGSGVFDLVIKNNFGEHVEVLATAEGFQVEFYEHD